jgi:hypothetical protein
MLALVDSLRALPFVTVGKLCLSLSGLELPILTIEDPEVLAPKKCIMVSGRAHPG